MPIGFEEGRIISDEEKEDYKKFGTALSYAKANQLSLYYNTKTHKYVVQDKSHKCLSQNIKYAMHEITYEGTVVKKIHVGSDLKLMHLYNPPNPTLLSAPQKINEYPTKRGLKVLGGYLCANTMTGAVCGARINSDATGKPTGSGSYGKAGQYPASLDDVDMMIKSGINYILLFLNFGQPWLPWGSQGNQTGTWTSAAKTANLDYSVCPMQDYWRTTGGAAKEGMYFNKGTEGGLPFQDPRLALAKLRNAGVTVLISIGCWDCVFPILNASKLTIIDGEGNSKPDSDGCASKLEAMLKTGTNFARALRQWQSADFPDGCGGLIDGFDFDIEGFGAGMNPAKEGAWCQDCKDNLNDGPQDTPLACKKSFQDTELQGNVGTDYTGVTGCYNFPDAGTIQWMNDVFQELKKPTGKDADSPSLVVTVVPVSTALYSNDTKVNQNQFLKAGLNFHNIDGIMLQWYSGSGIDICKDSTAGANGIQSLCPLSLKDDTVKKISNDFITAFNHNNRVNYSLETIQKGEKCPGPDDGTGWSQFGGGNLTANKIPSSPALTVTRGKGGKTFDISAITPETDCLNNDVQLEQTYINQYTKKSATYNYCPTKCPRKTDCPDWMYKTEKPFQSQIELLQKLDLIPGIDVATKVVIGLETFPNFPGKVTMGKGPMDVFTQFWGPLPSARGIIGLDNAYKAPPTKQLTSSPNFLQADPCGNGIDMNGIAGVGVFTIGSTFVTGKGPNDQGAALQKGAEDNLFVKLCPWANGDLGVRAESAGHTAPKYRACGYGGPPPLGPGNGCSKLSDLAKCNTICLNQGLSCVDDKDNCVNYKECLPHSLNPPTIKPAYCVCLGSTPTPPGPGPPGPPAPPGPAPAPGPSTMGCAPKTGPNCGKPCSATNITNCAYTDCWGTKPTPQECQHGETPDKTY